MRTASQVLTAAVILLAPTALAQDFTLWPGFAPDPHVETYISGGPNRVDGCSGYVSSQPDHVMYLTEDFEYLRLFVDSNGEDTSLVLHHPSSGDVFCDDDSYGDLQPEIVMDYITAGEWHVYVGSFSQDEGHLYELHVTELGPWFDHW